MHTSFAQPWVSDIFVVFKTLQNLKLRDLRVKVDQFFPDITKRGPDMQGKRIYGCGSTCGMAHHVFPIRIVPNRERGKLYVSTWGKSKLPYKVHHM